MNFFKKAYCRIYQTAFRAAIPFLPYRQPEILKSIEVVVDLIKSKGMRSVMLVTDAGLKKVGATERLEQLISDSGISLTVYDKTQANPTFANVEEALAAYKANGCEGLIAFGGGSSMDCAKAVGARVAYPKKTLDKLKGTLRVLRRIPLLIAIPTTAGTGSEVTLAAVITDGVNKHKYTMNDFTLIPRYAVLDPEVTFSLPPHLTATTGMDALTHAVEAYIGRSTTKYTRSMALKATKIIFENVYAAYSDGSNRAARENMLNAAYMAGIAFSQSYVGYIHAVAHSLGGQYNIPHGLANAVLMPHVLEEYGKSAYKKLHRLGVAAGVAREEDSHQEGAEKFISAIRQLNKKMGIPEKLEGIREEDIPKMAKHADKEANPLYPVPVEMNAKQLEKLYLKVM
ncbi:MAG: iron-containing alcohol dehydrogenase [Candidatus Coproplasma sp.]